MKKLFFIILTIFFMAGTVYAEYCLTRDYDGIEVPAGSFIPVVTLQDFSTAYCDSTNELKFVCNNDVFQFETKTFLLPQIVYK